MLPKQTEQSLSVDPELMRRSDRLAVTFIHLFTYLGLYPVFDINLPALYCVARIFTNWLVVVMVLLVPVVQQLILVTNILILTKKSLVIASPLSSGSFATAIKT